MLGMIQHSEEEYKKWLDYGSWYDKQAFCALLGHSHRAINQFEILQRTESGSHLWNLITIAVRDETIAGIKYEGVGFLRCGHAPCIAWLKWAMSKDSLNHYLPTLLLKAAGLVETRKQTIRTTDSYRPHDEPIIKATFFCNDCRITTSCIH